MGSDERRLLNAWDNEQAEALREPRPIVPGSCWMRKADGKLGIAGFVWTANGDRVSWRGFWDDEFGQWSEPDFRAAFEWVADPGERK